MAQLLTIAITLILILLLSTGSIGPTRLRRFTRKVNTWFFHDAQLFFPIDPYKPLNEAVRDGWKQFAPDRQRLRNILLLLIVSLAFMCLSILVSVVLLALH